MGKKKNWRKLGEESSPKSKVKPGTFHVNTDKNEEMEPVKPEGITKDLQVCAEKPENLPEKNPPENYNSLSAENRHGNYRNSREEFNDNRSHSTRTFRNTEKSREYSSHEIDDHNKNDRYQKHFSSDQQGDTRKSGNNYPDKNAGSSSHKDYNQDWRNRDQLRSKDSNVASLSRNEYDEKHNKISKNHLNDKIPKENYKTDKEHGISQQEENDKYSIHDGKFQGGYGQKNHTLKDEKKLLTSEKFKNNGNGRAASFKSEINRGNSQHNETRYPPTDEDNKNLMGRNKGSYGGHNDDQSNSDQHKRPIQQNSSYNQKNYNTESNTFNNDNRFSDKLKRGTGSGRDGNSTSYRPKNNSADRSSNQQNNNFRGGQGEGSLYRNDRGNRRHYEQNPNSSQYRRSSNSKREDANMTKKNDSWNNEDSRKFSKNKNDSTNQYQENWDNHPSIDKAHTQGIDDDWNDSATDESSWNVHDVSTSKPDAEGTTTSYLNDSGIGTTNLLPIISPGSSTLNPDAHSFHLPDNNPNWSEMVTLEENEAEAEAEIEKRRSHEPNQMAQSRPTTLEEQQDEASGPIYNTPKGESDRQNRKQRREKNRRGNDSRLVTSDGTDNLRSNNNNYGGVVSVGSTLSVDQPQYSEFSIDETQSERSSQQEDDERDYTMYKKPKYKTRWSDDRPKHDSSVEERSPRNFPPPRRSVNLLFHCSMVDGDDEWAEFKVYWESEKAGHFVKVIEDEKDLFTVGGDYSLAHCVAEDMNMGSGIAVEFRRRFKKVEELLNMRQKAGGLALLEVEDRFIYYMVTKKASSGKPTYITFWNSLKKLRDHIKEHKIERLAIPRIGCGLDRLDWNIVKTMVEFVFRELDVHILVCNFQQEDSHNSPNIQRSRRCKVVHEKYQISEIEQGTIVVYFASADGQPTPTMLDLDKKFNFLLPFKRTAKSLGDVIRFEDRVRNYILYGCIVRQKADDPFDFVQFGKCLNVIQKSNRKDGFVYVGFQKLEDDTDDILNEKVLNIITHSLRDVDIYCCSSTSFSSSLNDSLKAG